MYDLGLHGFISPLILSTFICEKMIMNQELSLKFYGQGCICKVPVACFAACGNSININEWIFADAPLWIFC